MEQTGSYRGFKELNCWKESRVLRNEVATTVKNFPTHEKFQLASQIIRSSRSVTNNIAEGYGRFTYTDTRHFFVQARGSVTETLDHISIAADENYITEDVANKLEKQCETIFKLINGYIAYLDKSKQS